MKKIEATTLLMVILFNYNFTNNIQYNFLNEVGNHDRIKDQIIRIIEH